MDVVLHTGHLLAARLLLFDGVSSIRAIFERLHFRSSASCCWFGHLGGREGCFQQWPLLGWRDSGGASTTSSRLRDCHELRPGLRPPHPPNLLSAPTIRQTHFRTGQWSNFINLEEILQPILSTFHRQILPYWMWRASIVISLVFGYRQWVYFDHVKSLRGIARKHIRDTQTQTHNQPHGQLLKMIVPIVFLVVVLLMVIVMIMVMVMVVLLSCVNSHGSNQPSPVSGGGCAKEENRRRGGFLPPQHQPHISTQHTW